MAAAGGLERLGIPTQSRARTWATRVVVLVVAGGAIAAFAAWWSQRRAPEPTYETARIERGEIVATVTATGTLRALNTVDVGAEVSGRVARVLVDFNDVVHRGDVLLEIEPDQLSASVAEARANVAASRAAVRIARTSADEAATSAERTEAMHARGLASDAELEQARAARARAEAEVASASARLEVTRASVSRAESALERAVVRSPIDGIVLSRTVEEGQTVAAQFQTPVLFQLAEDLTRMELHVDVDEADVGRVREQQRATFTVDAYPDRTFDATITSVRFAPRTVEGVVTYEAVLEVANAERLLRPGMTATASIVTERRSGVLLVPNAALRFVPPSAGGPFSRPSSADRPEGPAFWTLETAEAGQPRVPTPHEVRVVATDGARSEIAGEGVTEGREILVDATAPER